VQSLLASPCFIHHRLKADTKTAYWPVNKKDLKEEAESLCRVLTKGITGKDSLQCVVLNLLESTGIRESLSGLKQSLINKNAEIIPPTMYLSTKKKKSIHVPLCTVSTGGLSFQQQQIINDLIRASTQRLYGRPNDAEKCDNTRKRMMSSVLGRYLLDEHGIQQSLDLFNKNLPDSDKFVLTRIRADT
jgi:hypothetical protein